MLINIMFLPFAVLLVTMVGLNFVLSVLRLTGHRDQAARLGEMWAEPLSYLRLGGRSNGNHDHRHA